jgi:hypothetical protein
MEVLVRVKMNFTCRTNRAIKVNRGNNLRLIFVEYAQSVVSNAKSHCWISIKLAGSQLSHVLRRRIEVIHVYN